MQSHFDHKSVSSHPQLPDEMEQRLVKFATENEELKERCKCLENDVHSYESVARRNASEARKAQESIRYRIGTAFVDSVTSFSGFVKLPVRLFRLAREKLQKKVVHPALSPVNNKPIKKAIDAFDEVRHTLKSYSYHQFEKEYVRISEQGVLVVIPIYNAFEELQRCVESVLLHTSFKYELLLIDDCSTDQRVLPWLYEQEKVYDCIHIIAHSKNVGFVETANDGMRAARGDVVLLNSDTMVTDHWLEKLTLAAYHKGNVATVTPFSNAAGAFTVPEYGKNANLPTCTTLESMSRLVERCAMGAYEQVPTGNGFCIYIRHDAIEKIGVFDSKTFGKGYGEENDFCMRAKQNNFINLTCDDCYIFHKREASFRESKKELLENNLKLLKQRYPSYQSEIQAFAKDEQLCAFRRRIATALHRVDTVAEAQERRILYVLHEGGGGTPQTNADLMGYVQQNQYDPYLLICNGKVMRLFHVTEQGNDLLRTWQLVLPWEVDVLHAEEYRDIYFDVVHGLHIQLVHVRHLFKQTFDIVDVCSALHVPILLSFHDFYFICPTINLINSDMQYCDALCREQDKHCFISAGMIHIPTDTNTFTQTIWQPAVRGLLSKFAAFITTSQHTRDTYLKIFPEIHNRFYVIEHGRDFDYERIYLGSTPEGKRTRILLAGNLSESKGSKYIAELCEQDKEKRLEFHCIGGVSRKVAAMLDGKVIFHGEYAREDFVNKVNEIKPSYVAIFSIWPETHCHVLTEAFSCGIPCIISDIGALRERGLRMGGVVLVDINNAKSGYDRILENIQNIGAYNKLKQEACAAPLKSIAQMGAGYLSIYEKVLCPAANAMIYLYLSNQAHNQYFASSYIRMIRPILMNRDLMSRAAVCVLHKINELPQELPVPMEQYIVLQRDRFSEDDLLRIQGMPLHVVYETDDDLLAIAANNKTDRNAMQEKLSRVVSMAETVISTTDEIKTALGNINKTVIIPNCVDERLWLENRSILPQKERSTVRFLYMGTRTHEEDLQLIKKPFLCVKRRAERKLHVSVELYVVGVTETAEDWYRVSSDYPSQYPDFIQWLQKQKCDIAIAPLVLDSKLNNAKSFLNYLDYACMEIPAIFSPIPAYREIIRDGENGMLVADNSEQSWINAMYMLVADEALREKLAQNAYNDVIAHHLLKDHERHWSNTVLGYLN